MEALHSVIDKNVQDLRDTLLSLSHQIHSNPEIRFQERKASKWLADILHQHGFKVQREIGGLETAFRAEYPGTKDGPTVALICEYDALEGLGHACGHNIIATMGLGGALALAPLMSDLPGKLVVVGTPGEEGGGGKVILLENGVFDDIDAALMIHPYPKNQAAGSSLARVAWDVEYKGTPAHAAASPHLGINALDAVRLAFNGIDALRQQVTSDVRIHGIITKGGDAPNIIPDNAAMRVFVRAADRSYLYDHLVPRLKGIFEGAGLMTRAKHQITEVAKPYENMLINQALATSFEKHAERIGRTVSPYDPSHFGGSTDMGNVSQVTPGLHAYIAISDSAQPHTAEFAEAAQSPRGDEAVLDGASILASITADLFTDLNLLDRVKTEFLHQRNHSPGKQF